MFSSYGGYWGHVLVVLCVATISDRGGPLACRMHKTFPLCWQWYLQAFPAGAAVFAMLRSGHLPEPTLDGLQGPLDSPAPAIPYTDFTCP
jgi:hypothetical protein